jgi:hypothetical protein
MHTVEGGREAQGSILSPYIKTVHAVRIVTGIYESGCKRVRFNEGSALFV